MGQIPVENRDGEKKRKEPRLARVSDFYTSKYVRAIKRGEAGSNQRCQCVFLWLDIHVDREHPRLLHRRIGDVYGYCYMCHVP